jgi:hypothetical protein
MAGGRRNRTTTIILYPPTGSPASLGATITNRAINKPAARRFSTDDVKDPGRLVRMLNDMQEDIDQADAGIFSNPHNAPCILRGVAFSANQSKELPHTLDRPYTGWWIVRAQGAAPTLVEGSLPTGVTTDKAIQLTNTSGSSFTVDIAVTGD